jgi:hypothetical protein
MTTTLSQPIEWSRVKHLLTNGAKVYGATGEAWTWTGRHNGQTLIRGHHDWTPLDDTLVRMLLPPIPEPPDGARLEWEYGTDRYAAWRDDSSSAEAGWRAGEGGETWCLYPSSVPVTWLEMWLMFGDSLSGAVRLVPDAS